MTTLHMEPEPVRTAAGQLDQAAGEIFAHSEALQQSLGRLDWQGGNSERFVAGMKRLILSQRAYHEVDEWLAADAARDPSGVRLAAAGGGMAAAGAAVLGASTANPYADEYGKMTWSARFQEEARLQKEIADAQARLNQMRSEEAIQKDITDLDARIAELERKKAEAQAGADAWYNKVIPDWDNEHRPFPGDGDGLPWRTESDDYEDQVAKYDAEIQSLRDQRQSLQNELVARQQEAARLADLQARSSALSGIINRGVPPDGPTKPDWLRNQLAGCTLYVAGKRNVYAWPNANGQPGHPGDAQYWDNQARQAGYEIGSRPVNGSIMVFEADHGKSNDIMNVSDNAGHVAYVENVQRVNGGYKVTISQASTKYVNGDFVRGTYINQNTMTVLVKDGQTAASFVYDKPPQ
jgi:surface antigen